MEPLWKSQTRYFVDAQKREEGPEPAAFRSEGGGRRTSHSHPGPVHRLRAAQGLVFRVWVSFLELLFPRKGWGFRV